jgi:predicted kinase
MSEALERPPIRIPADALVILVGASGSGKSTFAARWFPAEGILSSDRLRAELTGDAADQSANGLTFRILHAQLERRLAAGRLAVVDATNVTAAARRPLLERAARFGRPVALIVLDLAEDACLARNAARPGRIVPAAAVRRQLAALRADRDQLARDLRPGDQLVVLGDAGALADGGALAILLTAADGQATLSPTGIAPANPAGRSRSRDS